MKQMADTDLSAEGTSLWADLGGMLLGNVNFLKLVGFEMLLDKVKM